GLSMAEAWRSRLAVPLTGVCRNLAVPSLGATIGRLAVGYSRPYFSPTYQEAMVSSLLDLTVQGDVATISDETKLPQVKLMTPLQLYRLWERQNWVSHEIDLSQDQRDWDAMPEPRREEMAWGLSAFFVGEERVTNQFSGLV